MERPSLTHEQLAGLAAKLQGRFYYDNSAAHQAILVAYATDASVYQQKPIAVAIPKTISDLKTLIAFASVYRVTLIPRTAGTSLAGQVVGQGIVVDVSEYFNQILEVNVEERWVRVQPGVIRDDLNAYLKNFGLMFGPETSTASRAMVGGMIGNNSSGLHSIVWGDTRSHLRAAKVLLDDSSEVEFKALTAEELRGKTQQQDREGEIYQAITSLLQDASNAEIIRRAYPKKSITRRNTGYALDLLLDQPADAFNMCTLLAGSEGTLGIITEAKLNLLPLPPKEVGIVCVHCNSVLESTRANIIALQHQPESSELVDKYILDFTKDHPTYKHNRFFIEGDPGALLMVEFRAETLEEIHRMAESLTQSLKAAGLGYAYPLITGPQTVLVWDVRKAGLGLIRNLPGDTQPVNLIEDCAVSPEDLPEYVQGVENILNKYRLQASYYAHAGAGELHIEPLINLKTKDGRVAFRQVLAETAKLVHRFNGSLSGEHGDGRLRGEFIPSVLGQEAYALLKEVKAIFDPQFLFNKGKIVDTLPMDEDLRYEVDPTPLDIPTLFSFKREESILRLAEKCSGSGDCRKTHVSGGTMCPSFMVTRAEKDTTRARANLLRQFLTQSTKANRFNHAEIKEAMDLCLSCKACKSECPSGVDIAKMKAEFLQHYYDANGTPFRTWIIANFTKSQKLAALVPGIYNFVIKQPWISGLVKGVIGFAKNRSLPEVGKTTFRNWVRRQQSHSQRDSSNSRKIFLFCDEFTNYNDVGIGQKAYLLLRELGYDVQLVDHAESGRTYLSKGLLREAKKIATRNVTIFRDLITADTPLLGIEPSAILTFRDEYPDLVDEHLWEDAKKLGKNALLIDEFLVAEMEKGRISAEQFTKEPKKIMLHGHCYQKAYHLVGATEKILSIPAAYSVETIPSGCCGMAGSFGYEKEHFDVSQKVSELVLMPAVRHATEDTIIAAPGTSCRHQIKDGANRMALHPVEILWDALNRKN